MESIVEYQYGTTVPNTGKASSIWLVARTDGRIAFSGGVGVNGIGPPVGWVIERDSDFHITEHEAEATIFDFDDYDEMVRCRRKAPLPDTEAEIDPWDYEFSVAIIETFRRLKARAEVL